MRRVLTLVFCWFCLCKVAWATNIGFSSTNEELASIGFWPAHIELTSAEGSENLLSKIGDASALPAEDRVSISPENFIAYIDYRERLYDKQLAFLEAQMEMYCERKASLESRRSLFIESQLSERMQMSWIGIYCALALLPMGIFLIIAGWFYAPAQKLDVEVDTKWLGIVKISGASAGVVALALSSFLIWVITNDALVIK